MASISGLPGWTTETFYVKSVGRLYWKILEEFAIPRAGPGMASGLQLFTLQTQWECEKVLVSQKPNGGMKAGKAEAASFHP